MKTESILEHVDMLDGLEFSSDRPTSRRSALGKMGKVGAGLAAAVLPTAFLTEKVSFAQTSAIDILNYALTLEYLEESYYRQATVDHASLFPSGDSLAAFRLIAQHEKDHVEFLTSAINAAGGDPVAFEDSDFDFTALGTNPFENFAFFLTLAMGFEDTGVRAYKGQAGNILGTPYLTPALQIHALEARHAAEVRRQRHEHGVMIDPWIVLDDGTDGTPLEPIYGAGMPADQFPPEENTTQGGADLTTLGFSAEEASASFDEPLDMESVAAIASSFITGTAA